MTKTHEHIIEHNSSDYQILEAAPATLPPRVNSELLKRHDAAPLFANLKIGKVGAQSRNLNYTSGTPRIYGREAWQSIVAAINESSSGIVGLLGHPDPYARTGFEGAVAVYWLQAKIESDQTVTATAYFPPGPARDHVITANALGMPIATSLFAKAQETESGEIVGVELEQLDLVLHKSAGLLDAVDSRFTLHTETKTDGTVVLHIPASQKHLIETLLKADGDAKKIDQIKMRLQEIEAAIAKENHGTFNAAANVWINESPNLARLQVEYNNLKERLNILQNPADYQTTTFDSRFLMLQETADEKLARLKAEIKDSEFFDIPDDDDDNDFKAITY